MICHLVLQQAYMISPFYRWEEGEEFAYVMTSAEKSAAVGNQEREVRVRHCYPPLNCFCFSPFLWLTFLVLKMKWEDYNSGHSAPSHVSLWLESTNPPCGCCTFLGHLLYAHVHLPYGDRKSQCPALSIAGQKLKEAYWQCHFSRVRWYGGEYHF